MKEYYIDLHSDFCPDKNWKPTGEDWIDQLVPDNWCDRHPNNFLFFLNNDFHIIRYHKCIASDNDYDFKRDLVERLCEKSKIFDYFKVEKSISLHGELNRFRREDARLRKYVNQINYLYYDMTGKEYAIVTKTNFLDAIINSDILNENYQKAIDYFVDKKMEYSLDYLKKLYEANYIGQLEEIEIVKTIDHLIKKINHGIKQES